VHGLQDSEIVVFVVFPSGCLVGKTLKSLFCIGFIVAVFSKWMPGGRDLSTGSCSPRNISFVKGIR
jgi:hypothetical protein